jgi:hydrogenase expression/formation protein HypD
VKYVTEFRDPVVARGLIRRIVDLSTCRDQFTLMEVCGTHTMAIHRHGIRRLLPRHVRMLSGPGCPVCVTPNDFLDRAIALARLPDVIVATFGDMMRVPGSSSSLRVERARGADVRVVYSTLDALQIARDEPSRRVVFLGVGFETTAPTVAAALLEAHRTGLSNFLVLAAPKLVIPAMLALVASPELTLDGFLCPGHVSLVIGSEPYGPLASEHGLPCVIAGFEPLDILQGIAMLVEQIATGRADVEIAYPRGVRAEGNPTAREVLRRAFVVCDANWRGIGRIPGSGLAVHPDLAAHDAAAIPVEVEPTRENPACACGRILSGVMSPFDCPLFGDPCTPDTPEGACMVSTEGTCAAAFRYGRDDDESLSGSGASAAELAHA